MIDPDDYELARQNYQMAIDIDDSLAEAHYYLGKLVAGGRKINEDGTFVIEPDYDLAKKNFRQTIELDEQNYRAHFNLAKVLATESDNTQAEGHFKQAIGINPGYAKAHFHLALLLIEVGRLMPEETAPQPKQPAGRTKPRKAGK